MQAALLAMLTLAAPAAVERFEAYEAPEEGSVRIVRDTYGVPHVIARDNRSLFFGVGYAQGEDQLANLVTNLLRPQGRAAEREGDSQLSIDHFVRLFKLPERARATFSKAEPEIKQQLVAYADGVNAYIAEHRDTVPEWIEPIQPHDVIGFGMYIDVMFSLGHCRRDLQRAGIELSLLEYLPSDDEPEFGSNQFAIAPERSATGACLLSMDPHLRHSGFFRWYEMHLVGPEINAMGATFFGNPYVSMGRTEKTAWCMTVNGPDLGDVFALQINPEDPSEYKALDGWRKFDVWEETYRVATEQGMVEKTMPAMSSEIGPVAAKRDNTAFAFALPTYDAPVRLRQAYDILKAQNVDEFRQALEHLGYVMFNIVYADARGDIFYISNGRVPRRDERIPSSEIRPGDQAWARWQGVHRQSELPQVLNPAEGYLLNTNSGPQNVTPRGAPRPEDFPGYMMSQRANSRSRRLAELLAHDDSVTFDEMRAYATDTRVENADEYVRRIVEGIRKHASSDADHAAQLNEIADVLDAWDGRTDRGSRGAVLYFYLMTDDSFVNAVQAEQPQQALAAAVEIARRVKDRFGSIDVAWKAFSRIRRGDHETGIAGTGSARAPSGVTAIQAALRPTYGELNDGRRYCTGGSSYGMIVDFSGATRAISCLPYGISEHPDSPHFADQMPLYARRQFKPAWFMPDEIAANIESERVLSTNK